MFCFGACSFLSYSSLSKKIQVLSRGNGWCSMMVSQANLVNYVGAKMRILQGFEIRKINQGLYCDLWV